MPSETVALFSRSSARLFFVGVQGRGDGNAGMRDAVSGRGGLNRWRRFGRSWSAAAHLDYHVGAIILVGSFAQERSRRAALDLLGPEIGGGARAFEEARRHPIDDASPLDCYQRALKIL